MNQDQQDTTIVVPKARSLRGFASMDPQRQREIASEGGKTAHVNGTAHKFDSAEAREAGRKGGISRAANKAARDALQTKNALEAAGQTSIEEDGLGAAPAPADEPTGP